jgi:competence ComEA-like helix-hairpin-helix protein
MGVSLADRGIAFSPRPHAPAQLSPHAKVGTQPSAADSTLVRTPASTTSGSLARLIDLNTAPASELDLLPGVGPVLAARIIEDRQANGLFKDLEDLDRVHGIGPRTIERLRDMVTVTAAAGD